MMTSSTSFCLASAVLAGIALSQEISSIAVEWSAKGRMDDYR